MLKIVDIGIFAVPVDYAELIKVSFCNKKDFGNDC